MYSDASLVLNFIVIDKHLWKQVLNFIEKEKALQNQPRDVETFNEF